MHYQKLPTDQPIKEIWQEKTVGRLSGGFNIQNFASFATLGRLPKGIPLNVDFATRNATAIKGVVVHANIGGSDTTGQVKKSELFAVGDFIGNATKAVQITAINRSNAAYDVITFSEALGAVSAGSTLFSATEAGAGKILTSNYMNYADVPYQPGRQWCTAVYAAIEVINAKLPYPLTTTQKSELGARFLVI